MQYERCPHSTGVMRLSRNSGVHTQHLGLSSPMCDTRTTCQCAVLQDSSGILALSEPPPQVCRVFVSAQAEGSTLAEANSPWSADACVPAIVEGATLAEANSPWSCGAFLSARSEGATLAKVNLACRQGPCNICPEIGQAVGCTERQNVF